MDTIAYVYKWTHIPTLKWYVGSRTAKGCHPDDGYICSSKHVKPKILSNPNDWKREIIETGNPTDIKILEAEILNCVDAMYDPRSYNMHNGDGKFTTQGMSLPQNEEHRRKRSEATKGRKNEWMIGHTPWNTGLTGVFRHSEEWKKWNSNRQRGEKNHMYGRKGKDNPNYGRKISEETRQKLILAKIKTPIIPLKCSCIKCHKEVTSTSIKNHMASSKCSANNWQRPKISCRFCKTEMWASSIYNHFDFNRCKEVNLEPKQA